MIWVKAENSDNGVIFSTASFTPYREGIGLDLAWPMFYMGVEKLGPQPNSFRGNSNASPRAVGTWLHMTLVWSLDSHFEMYFDGVPQMVTQDTDFRNLHGQEVFANSQLMYLGKPKVDTSPFPPNVVLDDWIIYSRPLSSSEIADIFGGMYQ